MTTPRDRISFGHHAFPFSGIRTGSLEAVHLPLLPFKVQGTGGRWSHPFNGILDTGSTRTLVPVEFGGRYGFRVREEHVKVAGIGGFCEARAAIADVASVEAHFPEVVCWEIHDATLWIVADDSLEYPVLGWDLLQMFEMTLDHRRQTIALRLSRR